MHLSSKGNSFDHYSHVFCFCVCFTYRLLLVVRQFFAPLSLARCDNYLIASKGSAISIIARPPRRDFESRKEATITVMIPSFG